MSWQLDYLSIKTIKFCSVGVIVILDRSLINSGYNSANAWQVEVTLTQFKSNWLVDNVALTFIVPDYFSF
jgi:hypothetical protein